MNADKEWPAESFLFNNRLSIIHNQWRWPPAGSGPAAPDGLSLPNGAAQGKTTAHRRFSLDCQEKRG